MAVALAMVMSFVAIAIATGCFVCGPCGNVDHGDVGGMNNGCGWSNGLVLMMWLAMWQSVFYSVCNSHAVAQLQLGFGGFNGSEA